MKSIKTSSINVDDRLCSVLENRQNTSKAPLHHLLVEHMRKHEQDVVHVLSGAEGEVQSYLFDESESWRRICLAKQPLHCSKEAILQDTLEVLNVAVRYLKEVSLRVSPLVKDQFAVEPPYTLV